MADSMIVVHANPYSFCKGGVACGVYPRDRINDKPGYVGARIDADATTVETLPKDHAGTPKQTTVYIFDLGPITVPFSQHYANGVRSGALFAGDDATAKRCGVKFVQPAKALADAKAKAIADERIPADAPKPAPAVVPPAPVPAPKVDAAPVAPTPEVTPVPVPAPAPEPAKES